MSEKYVPRHEQHASHETFDLAKEVQENLKQLESNESLNEEFDEKETEALEQEVKQEALRTEEARRPTAEAEPEVHSFATHAKLKDESYQKILTETRAQLPPSQQFLSKVFHQPAVEKVSDVASKTVARPVGVTWGAIASTVGVAIALFFSYRYGFEFNYLLLALLFIGGYVAATAIELTVKALTKYSH